MSVGAYSLLGLVASFTAPLMTAWIAKLKGASAKERRHHAWRVGRSTGAVCVGWILYLAFARTDTIAMTLLLILSITLFIGHLVVRIEDRPTGSILKPPPSASASVVVVLIQIAASITAAYHAGALEADFNGVSIAVERMVPETFDPEVRLRRPSVGQCLNRVPEVGEDSAQVVRCEQPFEAQVLSTGRPCPKTSDLDPDHQANTEIVSRKFGSLILCFAVGRGRELMSEPACVGELACTL